MSVAAPAPPATPAKLLANDCLQTPRHIYGRLGVIDLDPCAGPDTNIGKVNYAIERGEDGLFMPWFGFVFCNPPFSQKEQWADRMAQHGHGLLLLPERGSAPWFGPLARRAGRYWVMGQKINFIGGHSSNNLGSVFFPFGQEAERRLIESGLPGHLVEVTMFRPRSIPPAAPASSPSGHRA